MNPILVYDLKKDIPVQFPPPSKGQRLSIVFFYWKRCIPSITQLNYFSTYASSHRTQVIMNFISRIFISFSLISSIILSQSILIHIILMN
jgi:hypothetical protein